MSVDPIAGEPRLVVRGRAQHSEVTLELDSGQAPWGGVVSGRLWVHCGDVEPQRLLACAVHLLTPVAGTDSTLPVGTAHAGDRTLHPGEEFQLPFHFKVGWGTAYFGPRAMLQVVVRTPGIFWSKGTLLTQMLEIVPPPGFVAVAAAVAEMTDLNLGLWKVVSGGDGAAIALSSTIRANPFRAAFLELFRGPDRDYGSLILDPRKGAPGAADQRRRFSLHFERDDPNDSRRVVTECLTPVLNRSERLPIPAAHPDPDGSVLPRAADPNSATKQDRLRRPTDRRD